jgi:hypothetical protein
MIRCLLTILSLGDGSLNGSTEWRRRHVRHDACKARIEAEVETNGRSYSLRDWSMGGLCCDAEAAPPLGQKLDMQIRFRLPHETVTIRHSGYVVRVLSGGMAIEFAPPAPETRRRLWKVIDDIHVLEFMQSQVA